LFNFYSGIPIAVAALVAITGCNPLVEVNGVSVISDRLDDVNLKNIKMSSISPSSGFIGGNTITINGSGFSTDNYLDVKIGNYDCESVSIINDNTVTCTVPAVSATLSKSADVIVQNSKFSSKLENAYEYSTGKFNSIEQFYGSTSYAGFTDGTSQTAKLNRPSKPLIVGSDMYISDTANHTIRKYDMQTERVTTVVGTVGVSGTTDATGTSAKLNNPTGMVLVGQDIYFVDNGSCLVRKFNISTLEVTTIAGQPNQCDNSSDNANGLQALLYRPTALAYDGNQLFLADSNRLKQISLSGSNQVTTLFYNSLFMITDLAYLNSMIYYITFNTTTAYIRRYNISTHAITSIKTIQFGSSGLVTDGTDLYASSSKQNIIQKLVVSSNTLSTLAGNGLTGNQDGINTAAMFNAPVFMDYSNGVLYIASFGSHNIRSLNLSSQEVITLIGNRK